MRDRSPAGRSLSPRPAVARRRAHPFKGVYREVAAPERVVFTQVYDVEPFSIHEVIVTNTFSEQDGRTTLTQHLLFDSLEARDGMVASGMERGEAQSFDRLDELLAELGGSGGAGARGPRAQSSSSPATSTRRAI
ncbi:MAG: SRPBCC domain-containing protein [Candidatus Limnocylindrales bacterium]